ncbi:hypothetical protein MYX65_12265 [Acidobacteria bacterium AH-259-L09]|nr:hypothetical protein [Acidobacteria bacterium AH-259-L09]
MEPKRISLIFVAGRRPVEHRRQSPGVNTLIRRVGAFLAVNALLILPTSTPVMAKCNGNGTCEKGENAKNCPSDCAGGGGAGDTLFFDAVLTDDGETGFGGFSPHIVCGNNGPTVFTHENPEGVEILPPEFLPDQLFGLGGTALDSTDKDSFQVAFQKITNQHDGGVNRVIMPWDDLLCEPEGSDNDRVTVHGRVRLFFSRDGDTILIGGYKVTIDAREVDGQRTRTIFAQEVGLDPAVPLNLEEETVIPIYKTFMFEQRGGKQSQVGTLSLGEVRLTPSPPEPAAAGPTVITVGK